MKRLLLAASILTGTAALTLPADAGGIIYQLNTSINGNTLTQITSLGTVAYTDNGDKVNVDIDFLTPLRAKKMTMNFNDATMSSEGLFFDWSISGDALDINVDENDERLGHYKFDITLSDFDSYPEPFTFSLALRTRSSISGSWTTRDLNPSDFDFATLTGDLFNAIQIYGDCDDYWVGSRAVPEPTSLAVLGLGVAALGLIRRRKI